MTTAAEIQQAQLTFAQNALTGANGFISDLQTLSRLPEIVIDGLPVPDYANSGIAADPLSTRDFLLQFRPLNFLPIVPQSNVPVPPTFDIAIPDDVVVPSFDASAPVLEIPPVPSNALPTAPNAPDTTEPTIPAAPTITLPSPPMVGSIVLPTPPTIITPQFAGVLPPDDLIAPTASFSWTEAAYTSANLEALEDKLLDQLENGGYGIEPADEAGLWQRGRDRENIALDSEVGRIMQDTAGRGFPLPPGSMVVAIQKATEDSVRTLSSLSREIMLKRGDLYVENRKFTIQETRQLEAILIAYYGGRMERALNAQRATLEFSIKLFEALVARYNARMVGYQAQAVVFAKQLEASLIQVQVYKATMEGKAIEANIQRTLVEAYKATLQGLETQVNIYRVSMQAAQVQADIQRLKIEAYKSRIDAYSQQVQAKVAEFNLYKTQIEGQVSRVQAYEAEARAYTAAVSGSEAQARIKGIQVDAAVKEATLQLDVYKGDLERYRTDLQTQSQLSQTLVAYYNAQTGLYQADVAALVESYRLAQGTYANDRQYQLENAKIATSNATLAFEALKTLYNIKVAAGGTAGDYYGKLIAGAQSALTSVASLEG